MTQPVPSGSCPPSEPVFSEAAAQELEQESSHKLAPTPVQYLPLRGRDLQALKELFIRSEIEAIESDILQNLGWRCPEPCWEDDPFEFLREYL